MEHIQILKFCPWISEPIDVEKYFDKYHKILDEVNGMKSHTDVYDPKQRIREFFHIPDELDVQSQSTTPVLTSQRSTPSGIGNKEHGNGDLPSKKEDIDDDHIVSLTEDLKGSMGVNINSNSNDKNEPHTNLERDDDDPFDIVKMEEACSIDLLSVEGELPPRDMCNSSFESGRVFNWYAGSFMDGVIPDGASDKLSTLESQKHELFKRETVKDYLRLRNRQLKYSSTVRMVLKDGNTPESVSLKDDSLKPCIRETIFNIRIQRPYHKKVFHKKGSTKYPPHSQELLMLGCQSLSELQKAIVCMNDVYVHKNMSENPDLDALNELPMAKDVFPSSMFYINGGFYTNSDKDYSDVVRNWAKKIPQVPEMKAKDMSLMKLGNLAVRLGYPYLYQHLGSCEHHIIFTDVRLVTRTDIQDVARYPLSRGIPVKHAVRCYICNLFLACWLVKDDPELPVQTGHFCDACLKTFCFDGKKLKHPSIKIYPFMDEFKAHIVRQNERFENRVLESNGKAQTLK